MNIEIKKCSKCELDKELSYFSIDNSSKNGLRSSCKECNNEYKRLRRLDTSIKDMEKKYVLLNKEHINNRNKKWRSDKKLSNKKFNDDNNEIINCKYCNSDKELSLFKTKYKCNDCSNKSRSVYIQNNIEQRKISIRKYNNSEKRKEKRNDNRSNRILVDNLYVLTCNIRGLISNIIKYNGYSKKSKTEEILGCSFEFFKKHIESKFKEWMTWENKGLYNGEFSYGWDIDHIIPVSSAENEEELIILNHYTNLQPLCSHINRNIKRNKINYEIS